MFINCGIFTFSRIAGSSEGYPIIVDSETESHPAKGLQPPYMANKSGIIPWEPSSCLLVLSEQNKATHIYKKIFPNPNSLEPRHEYEEGSRQELNPTNVRDPWHQFVHADEPSSSGEEENAAELSFCDPSSSNFRWERYFSRHRRYY